jgi:hypothetical protein
MIINFNKIKNKETKNLSQNRTIKTMIKLESKDYYLNQMKKYNEMFYYGVSVEDYISDIDNIVESIIVNKKGMIQYLKTNVDNLTEEATKRILNNLKEWKSLIYLMVLKDLSNSFEEDKKLSIKSRRNKLLKEYKYLQPKQKQLYDYFYTDDNKENKKTMNIIKYINNEELDYLINKIKIEKNTKCIKEDKPQITDIQQIINKPQE